MWQLLIPVALWLGMVGLGRAELTAAQQRGLQVALEEFHKHPPVQWAFKEIGVDSATDTLFPAGTFVRLEFKLQQTSCRKKDWKKAECKVKPNGRKRKCLACIKLNSADKVLGRMVHCPILTQVQRNFVPLPGQQEVTSERPTSHPHAQGGRSHYPRANKTALPDSCSPPLVWPPSRLNCGSEVLQEGQETSGPCWGKRNSRTNDRQRCFRQQKDLIGISEGEDGQQRLQGPMGQGGPQQRVL
ncbi:retinoic acid receptor responder protein 2 isoform X1 [Felis catus]|nr:retinoic acid receptor responder protein 2 isoform X1 [Felis catus]XP_019681550.2 retinoic acid receptor responder protein 2 isoform X1 [Felis catus]XP_019681551.2 retinoic acid receptor responder protein 2 isoform X1 [Felis catus]XP_019681552.2 retinoic acid receptor responder protein 2 isoform X1 [Felis catus]